MPYYKGVIDELIESGYSKAASGVADRLLRLRTRLKKAIPQRNVSESVLIATWNIREFGRNQKCGVRLPESLLYIAEIISHFDLVAVQEVHSNLSDLKKLMHLLGDWWEYIVTDVTPGRSGNEERTAFIFDGRKVRFDHLAGELVLPPKKEPVRQPARSPFICAFRAGWRRIALCTVHIYYGEGKPNDETRVEEISSIAKLLADRNVKRQLTPDGEPENIVLIGDFNIFNQMGDETSAALDENGFIVPRPLMKLPASNLGGDKYFDQIAFHDPQKRLHTGKAGVFKFTDVIYGDAEHADYREAMKRSAPAKFKAAKNQKTFYSTWRTFQISDHLPLWIELKTNFANAYLAKAMRGR